MSVTINAEGDRGRNYVIPVESILYCLEVTSLHSQYACNIVLRDKPQPIECTESIRIIQGRIEEAKTQHKAELTCIVEALAALYRDNVDVATTEGRAVVSAVDYDSLLSTIAQIHDVAAAALGRPGRLADEALKPDYDMARLEQALDVDFEVIRVLHRVVRAARDGECMQCSAAGTKQFPSTLQPPAYPEFDKIAFRCSTCGFEITKDQVDVAFKHWRGVAANNMAAWQQFWQAAGCPF